MVHMKSDEKQSCADNYSSNFSPFVFVPAETLTKAATSQSLRLHFSSTTELAARMQFSSLAL